MTTQHEQIIEHLEMAKTLNHTNFIIVIGNTTYMFSTFSSRFNLGYINSLRIQDIRTALQYAAANTCYNFKIKIDGFKMLVAVAVIGKTCISNIEM